jgi:hypothetical protein
MNFQSLGYFLDFLEFFLIRKAFIAPALHQHDVGGFDPGQTDQWARAVSLSGINPC